TLHHVQRFMFRTSGQLPDQLKGFSMKTFIVSAAIIAAMGASVPLAAQSPYGSSQRYEDQRDRGWNSGDFWRGAPTGTWERISFVQQRIDQGTRDGSLD